MTIGKRKNDPLGYRATVIELVNALVPKEFNKLDCFLSLKDNSVSSISFKPADGEEFDDVYGAFVRILPSINSKYEIRLIFSNNESEPLPYLIPLIIHELQHVLSFKDKILMFNDEKKSVEYGFVEEARAFDVQMQTYLAVARKEPELFCNWLYETWSYAEIPVPLSWTMASMEKELLSGKYMVGYAKMSIYKHAPYLLNQPGTDLRADIRERIQKLNLKYVK